MLEFLHLFDPWCGLSVGSEIEQAILSSSVSNMGNSSKLLSFAVGAENSKFLMSTREAEINNLSYLVKTIYLFKKVAIQFFDT